MIDTIKALLRGIGRAGSYLVPYRSGGRLSTLGDYLYTAWLARHFKHIGANVYIRRPVSLRGGKYISIGSHSVIQKGCILNAWDRYGDQSFTPEIAIGEHVSIGEWSHLSAIRAIRIGNYVRTGRRVTIVDNSHGRGTSEELGMHPEDQPLYSKGVVTIGNNVRIADKVTILVRRYHRRQLHDRSQCRSYARHSGRSNSRRSAGPRHPSDQPVAE